MTARDFTALLRRHMFAVLGVLVIALGIAYTIKTAPATYTEGGTVVFNPPVSGAFPNPYAATSGSLITTGGVVSLFMMGPQGHQQVQAAGGTTPYNVTLVNSYNQEYPNYSTPESTVYVTGTDLAGVQRTLAAVMQVLTRQLAMRQSVAGVPPADLITAQLVGNPGPLAQPGSHKRVFGGLLLLTAIAVFTVCVFLDRHPIRLNWLGRSRGARRTTERRPLADA